MTHYPRSTSRPVPSHSGPMAEHLGLVLHCTTNHASPFGFFSNPKNQASSNWWVSDTGQVEEYVTPDLTAWAQADGNSTYNSVETSGTPDQPLTAAQIEAVAQLYAWGHSVYGWPMALASKPGDRGLGWHGMGGAAWGGHTGCPGSARLAQRATILKRAQAILTPAKPAPAKSASPYRYTHLPLQTGSRNVDVAHAQKRLGITVDGVFGPDTAQHVRAFQAAHHLTVDGVLGPQTAKALG